MVDEPSIGAHLTTPRLGYVHHGIYAGGGRVIHYRGIGRRLRSGPVEEISIEEFTRGRPLSVKAPKVSAFCGEARVARARSRLGENRYRLWSNNCEHFSEWCISGFARSPQIDRWARRLGLRRAQTSAGSVVEGHGAALPSSSGWAVA
jgi:lecithin:retinol acyltransferase